MTPLLSGLMVSLFVAPLALGTIFAIWHRKVLKRPILCWFGVTAEGCVLAGVLFALIGGDALVRIGLSGVPSQGGSSSARPESYMALTLGLFIVSYVALLWWNFRVLPKRAR